MEFVYEIIIQNRVTQLDIELRYGNRSQNYYGKLVRICMKELYCGMILRYYIMESYYRIMLWNDITESDYGIILWNYIMELHNRVISQN